MSGGKTLKAMYRIVDKSINIEFPQGHHLHALVCQVPNHVGDDACLPCGLADPEKQWQHLRAILDLAGDAPGNLKRLHFLILPESVMPADRVEDALALIRERFRPNTVTLFGVEHVRLTRYLEFLRRYREDNEETLASVLADLDSGDVEGVPVNWSVAAIKEADGRLRVFLQAKSHPFGGEETIDSVHDLYRGKVFPLFRCTPVGFNFMAMICIDYIYRDLYQSNISEVIARANQLFFQTRQRLDLLVVLQCNPKPEHPAFRDVVNGFYGEYLSCAPGVRDTVTIFCNTSEETTGIACKGECPYGYSSVIIHRSHKINASEHTGFASDDFGGLPVCRLRFGKESRLYYFNLPLFHELDPRTTRFPLKIHGIYRPEGDGWQLSDDDEGQTKSNLQG